MGDNDVITKKYLEQNDVFADVFNYYLFDGERVIDPDDLLEQDPVETITMDGRDKHQTAQKVRDLLKLCTIKRSKIGTLVLLGIEAQSNVHYAMPVRNYVYDALNYNSQLDAIRKRHLKAKDLKGAEMLSGFSRTDHLVPVITLCICFDKQKWDGPRSLFDMFGEIDDRITNFVDDYHLHLITPDEIEDFSKFASDMGFVLEIIHNSDDKKRMCDIIEANEDKSVDVQTVRMINAYTELDLPTDNTKGGQVMVCQAVKELREDWFNEGLEEGMEKGREKWLEEGREEGVNIGEAKLLRLMNIIPQDSTDFNIALKGSKSERKQLYKKYNIE